MRHVWMLVFGLFLSAAAFGQAEPSLADVARANRANKQSHDASGNAPKVITNQDVAPGSEEKPPADSMSQVSGVNKTNRAADQRLSNQLQAQERVSAQWKARIQDQETKIADLQARIDRVKAQIQQAVGTASYDTPANRYQAVQNEKLVQLQETLDQEKRKLSSMQDEARRAGAGQ